MRLKSFLIDPFQKTVRPMEIENNIDEWHKVLDCQIYTHVMLGKHRDKPIDLWVDDEGLLRQPNYPYFYWIGYHEPLCGYGMINSSTGPESISSNLSLQYVATRVQFENWEERLNPEDYFEQMTKIYPVTEIGEFGIGSTEVHICSICQKPYQGWGNNADPYEGRCCDECNQQFVIPARMKFGRKGAA